MGKEIAAKPLTEADARAFVNSIKSRIGDIRAMLIELHDRLGWQALGYDSWKSCVAKEFPDWSKRHADRQRLAGQIQKAIEASPQKSKTVGPIGPTRQPPMVPESLVRPLSSLPEDQQVAAYMDAKEEADKAGEPLTAKDVKTKADLYKADNEPYVAPEEPKEEPEEEEEAPEPTAEESMATYNKALESLARQVTALGKDPEDCGPLLLESSRLETFQGQLRTAAGTLRASKGHEVCPDCDGDGCDQCDQLGMLTKTQSESRPRD